MYKNLSIRISRSCIVLLLIIHGPTLLGQSVSLQRDVLASSGTDTQAGALHLSWTLGEFAVATLESQGSLVLTQGFQQGKLTITPSGIDPIEPPVLDIPLKLYPNPTTDVLWIEGESQESLLITIVDLQGRQVYAHTGPLFPSLPQSVQTQNWSEGHYFLRILQPSTGKAKGFTIQKR